eukprot:scaffold122934_cov18-Prasinocladus_malaysianus.AAC.1
MDIIVCVWLGRVILAALELEAEDVAPLALPHQLDVGAGSDAPGVGAAAACPIRAVAGLAHEHHPAVGDQGGPAPHSSQSWQTWKAQAALLCLTGPTAYIAGHMGETHIITALHN